MIGFPHMVGWEVWMFYIALGLIGAVVTGLATLGYYGWKDERDGHRKEAEGSGDSTSETALTIDPSAYRIANGITYTPPAAGTLSPGPSVKVGLYHSGGPVNPGGFLSIPTSLNFDAPIPAPEPPILPTTVYSYKGLLFTYPYFRSPRNKMKWHFNIPSSGWCDQFYCSTVPTLSCNCGIHGAFDYHEALDYVDSGGFLVAFAATGRAVIGHNDDGTERGIRCEKAQIVAACTIMIPRSQVEYLLDFQEAMDNLYHIPVFRAPDELVEHVEGLKMFEAHPDL